MRKYRNLIFNLSQGSSDIPRFSCACHKLNLAVRHAISKHSNFQQLIDTINKANAGIRRSHELNKIFLELKCRLKLENLTRWSSCFMMLRSVKRAFELNAFDGIEYPVTLADIDFYIQILLPAYEL